MWTKTTLLLLGLAFAQGSSAALADGELDPSFGVDGKVNTDINVGLDDEVRALLVLPDGRAVAAGFTAVWVVPDKSVRHLMAAARYLDTGALDPSFGSNGIVTVDFGQANDSHTEVAEVLLQPDGRMVLAGRIASTEFALARLMPDGSLDSSFGTDGRATAAFPDGFAYMRAGVLQPDGRIVFLAVTGPTTRAEGTLARFLSDGSLDPTFGNGGMLTLPLPQRFVPADLVLQPDGKLVIAGTAGPYGGNLDFGLVRVLPGGGLDPVFGTNGMATSDFGSIEQGRALALLGDGRLVVGGHRGDLYFGDFVLARYLPDGSLDTTFGSGGLASSGAAGPATPEGLLVQEDGKLVLAGWTFQPSALQDFVLERFHANGAIDERFGAGGLVRTDFQGSYDRALAVAVAGPGRLLAAGYMDKFPDYSFALARYTAATPVELMSFGIE